MSQGHFASSGTAKESRSKTYCPVSESSVSGAGHMFSNKIMTQNTQLQAPEDAKNLAGAEVSLRATESACLQ